MGTKKIINEIEADVGDILKTEFSYSKTKNVPNLEDSSFTFGNGEEKKAKVINTCVLFVDIRSSVALTQKHHPKTMGKLYSAFAKAILKTAHYHGGYVRNIIGDRVMVVFPSDNCFTNSVNCAITINHLSSKVINKQFNTVDFKCGIGIDYGELKVIKVGTPKQGSEANENRGLVWTGYPANLASRLTDFANKGLEEEYYVLKRKPFNPAKIFRGLPFLDFNPFGSIPIENTNIPTYLDKIETVEMNAEEFASSIIKSSEGELDLFGGKFVDFEKKMRQIEYPPILITKKVYSGYKKDNSSSNDIKNKWWENKTYKVQDVKESVYGSSLTWELN